MESGAAPHGTTGGPSFPGKAPAADGGHSVERGRQGSASLSPSLLTEIALPIRVGATELARVVDACELERVWRRQGFQARVQSRSLPLAHALLEYASRPPVAIVLAFPSAGGPEQLTKRITACLSRFPTTLVLGDLHTLAAVAPSATLAALQPGERCIIALPCGNGWEEVARAAAAYHRRASDVARRSAAAKHLLRLPRREVEEPGCGPLLASLGLSGDVAAAARVGARIGTSIRAMVQPQAVLAAGPASRVAISGAAHGRGEDTCSDDELAAWASWCEQDSLNAAARLDDIALRPLYVRRPFAGVAEDAYGRGCSRPSRQGAVGAEPAR